jgi:hypothetical protein
MVKVFRLLRLEWIVLVFTVWTQKVDVQHLIYWQGQRVCDALLNKAPTQGGQGTTKREDPSFQATSYNLINVFSHVNSYIYVNTFS